MRSSRRNDEPELQREWPEGAASLLRQGEAEAIQVERRAAVALILPSARRRCRSSCVDNRLLLQPTSHKGSPSWSAADVAAAVDAAAGSAAATAAAAAGGRARILAAGWPCVVGEPADAAAAVPAAADPGARTTGRGGGDQLTKTKRWRRRQRLTVQVDMVRG